MKKVICRDKDNNKQEIKTEKLQFRPSVYAVIFNKERNKILLSKQWDGYDYPGGGIKKGERISKALKREVYEEVGVRIEDARLITCNDDFYLSKNDNASHSILIYYVANKFIGKPTIKNIDKTEIDYISGFEWVNIKEIENIKFYNSVDNMKIVRRALKIFNKIK
jgi:8-oxo-dGTP diphosphatase